MSNEWVSFFISAALKSVVVLGAAWLTTVLLRKRSAAARHLVWTAASAALLALPFLTLSLPALPLGVPHALLPPGVAFETTAAGSADTPPAQTKTLTNLSPQSHPYRPDWRVALVLLWSAGAAISLLRMAMAWAAIWRIRRSSDRFPIADLEALAGPVDVLKTRPGSMPMTFGMLRPTILLPADAAEWSEERRRVVVLHELAHVRRGDFAMHVLARTALGLYWWNPLAWIAWRESLKERERAADDLVLTAGAPAAEYAGHLLDIARAMQSTPAVEWAAVGMARRSQLEGRLLAVLDSGVNRQSPRRASVWIAALLAVAIVVPLAALRAQEKPDQSLPPDVDAVIRAAAAQKNHEILENAAKAAETLHKYDVAEKLLESSLAVREEVSGPQSVDYGVGLLKLGDLARRRGQVDEAQAFYTKAAATLGNQPEAARALTYLGFAAARAKEFDKAIDYFERARLVNPAKAGEALMWMAIVRERQQSPEEADQLFRQALALEDPNSAEASTIMHVYARFLSDQGRADESKSTLDRAVAITKAHAVVREPKADTYRIGKGVTPPKIASKVEPQYSDEARAAKLQGTAVVYAEIGPDGVPHNVSVTQGLGLGLDENAVAAIQQWRFTPGMKDGQPVNVAVTIEINFKLM